MYFVGFLSMVIFVVSLYTQCLRHNICSAWFLDIRIYTCCNNYWFTFWQHSNNFLRGCTHQTSASLIYVCTLLAPCNKSIKCAFNLIRFGGSKLNNLAIAYEMLQASFQKGNLYLLGGSILLAPFKIHQIYVF